MHPGWENTRPWIRKWNALNLKIKARVYLMWHLCHYLWCQNQILTRVKALKSQPWGCLLWNNNQDDRLFQRLSSFYLYMYVWVLTHTFQCPVTSHMRMHIETLAQIIITSCTCVHSYVYLHMEMYRQLRLSSTFLWTRKYDVFTAQIGLQIGGLNISQFCSKSYVFGLHTWFTWAFLK